MCSCYGITGSFDHIDKWNRYCPANRRSIDMRGIAWHYQAVGACGFERPSYLDQHRLRRWPRSTAGHISIENTWVVINECWHVILIGSCAAREAQHGRKKIECGLRAHTPDNSHDSMRPNIDHGIKIVSAIGISDFALPTDAFSDLAESSSMRSGR